MSALREAALEALEALWFANARLWFGDKTTMKAISSLQAALAQPEPRNQCGETCERAKLCAVCARGLALPRLRTRQRADQHDLPVQGLAEDGDHMLSRDDILRMAREAGLFEDGKFFVLEHSELERFFKTAYEAGAAAERENVARWMRERGYATGHGDTVEALLEELRTQEREACAKVFAAAIRARGDK